MFCTRLVHCTIEGYGSLSGTDERYMIIIDITHSDDIRCIDKIMGSPPYFRNILITNNFLKFIVNNVGEVRHI